MVYQGSKRRLAKYIASIINSCIKHDYVYLEPFVGGCNLFFEIEATYKIGNDINPYLIDLIKLVCIKPFKVPEINNVTRKRLYEDYNYVKEIYKTNPDLLPKWFIALYLLGYSYRGSWCAGLAIHNTNDINSRLEKQIAKINEIHTKFKNDNSLITDFYSYDYAFFLEMFLDRFTTILCEPEGVVIYLDPPYPNEYQGKYISGFEYDEKFYNTITNFIMVLYHIYKIDLHIFISGTSAPANLPCDVVFEKDINWSASHSQNSKLATEKLFKVDIEKVIENGKK